MPPATEEETPTKIVARDGGGQPASLSADALQLAAGFGGSRYLERLKTDFANLFPPGARLWTRNQGEWYFVSPNPDDTLLFPSDHPRAMQDRYTWSDHPTIKGAKIGKLIAE